jgi:hypothetical protein
VNDTASRLGIGRMMDLVQDGDREGLRRVVAKAWHEDCEWIPLIAGVEGTASYHGHDGLIAFYEDFWRTFEVRYGENEVRRIGDALVVLGAMELRGRESGVELQTELGILLVLDGELIRWGKAYDSHGAAVAAAEELAHA